MRFGRPFIEFEPLGLSVEVPWWVVGLVLLLSGATAAVSIWLRRRA